MATGRFVWEPKSASDRRRLLAVAFLERHHGAVRSDYFDRSTEHLLQQSFDHIDRLSKTIKETADSFNQPDYLPFRSLKWAFLFAESLCTDLIPSMRFEITALEAPRFMESYNRALKTNFQAFVAESAKLKRSKTANLEGTSEQSDSDN